MGERKQALDRGTEGELVSGRERGKKNRPSKERGRGKET
jgi:hypothetical protein